MYRHCIYCSAGLGANEALEAFPVGRMVAVDAAKGRLWAVCAKCARWNLAPIEERWAPVEAAEKAFVDARLRVQRENVGIATLPDGTRLFRVGDAVQGELAAWRYGRELARRRGEYVLATIGWASVRLAIAGAATVLSGDLAFLFSPDAMVRDVPERQVIHYAWLPGARGRRGREIPLERWHAPRAVLRSDGAGAIALEIPAALAVDPDDLLEKESVVLGDAEARMFLPRAMVYVNRAGAGRRRMECAVSTLAAAGNAEACVRRVAASQCTLGQAIGNAGARPLAPADALALEMALHEESERRALEGELALLESAWREAEEIAAIADTLALAPEAKG